MAAVQITAHGFPLAMRMDVVPGFRKPALAQWAKRHLAPGTAVVPWGLPLVVSDGLNCFPGVTAADCTHVPLVREKLQPYCLHSISNGKVEGNYSELIAIQRSARGFRSHASFRILRPVPLRQARPLPNRSERSCQTLTPLESRKYLRRNWIITCKGMITDSSLRDSLKERMRMAKVFDHTPSALKTWQRPRQLLFHPPMSENQPYRFGRQEAVLLEH